MSHHRSVTFRVPFPSSTSPMDRRSETPGQSDHHEESGPVRDSQYHPNETSPQALGTSSRLLTMPPVPAWHQETRSHYHSRLQSLPLGTLHISSRSISVPLHRLRPLVGNVKTPQTPSVARSIFRMDLATPSTAKSSGRLMVYEQCMVAAPFNKAAFRIWSSTYNVRAPQTASCHLTMYSSMYS